MVFVHIEELYDIVEISIPNEKQTNFRFLFYEMKINESNLI